MQKTLLITIMILTIALSACSMDDTGNVYSHLNDQDPSSMHDKGMD